MDVRATTTDKSELGMGVPYQDSFVDYLHDEKRASEHTISAYQRDLTCLTLFLKKHLGVDKIDDAELRALTEIDVQAYQAQMLSGEHCSKVTVNRRLSAMKTYFKWLSRVKGIDNEAVISTKGMKVGKQLPKALSKTDALKVVKALMPPSEDADMPALRDFVLVMVLYGMGLRVSEALSLNIGNVRADYVYVHGKGKKERRLPIPKSIISVVQRLIHQLPDPYDPKAPLFINQKQKRRMTARSAQYLLKRLRESMGLPEHLTPHALRHCFATHLLNGGTDIRTIQALLGHESLAATERYLAISIDALKETHKTAHPLERN